MNNYINKIHIPKNSIYRKKWTFDCTSVNIIVGNQGTGKSTLLENMIHSKMIEMSENSTVGKFLYFNTETMNPRMLSLQNYTTPSGKNVGIGYGNALMSRFMSHGETLVKATVEALENAKDSIILLDEPESALSVQNQYRLIDAINIAVSNGCQLFICTHCVPLILEFDVISLDHYKIMSGEKYINGIKRKKA